MVKKADTGRYRVLSASQMNKIIECPRRWGYEYVEGIKPPPEYPLIQGIFVHETVEIFNRNFAQVVEEPTSIQELAKQAEEYILQCARHCWKDGAVKGWEDEIKEKKNRITGILHNHVTAVIDRCEAIAQRKNLKLLDALSLALPSINELNIKVLSPGDKQWVFVGSIDAVIEKNPLWYGDTCLVDYKTGHAPEPGSTLNASYIRQMHVYTWLFYQAYGAIPERVGIRFLEADPGSDYSLVMFDTDPGIVLSIHSLIENIRNKTISQSLEDYFTNTDFQWCYFEKNNGEVIKCPHWDYCQGEADMPASRKSNFRNNPDRVNIEHVLRDPRTETHIPYIGDTDISLRSPKKNKN